MNNLLTKEVLEGLAVMQSEMTDSEIDNYNTDLFNALCALSHCIGMVGVDIEVAALLIKLHATVNNLFIN